PRNVIKQLFGSQVKGEVRQNVIEQSLMEVLRERELPIVAMPRVDDMSETEDGAPLSFKAIVEARPKLESIDTALAFSLATAVLSDEAVDAEIERLRERNAVIETPDPMRPAKSGDLLTIDYTVEIDAEERPDMAAKELVLELGSGRMPPEFDEG